MKIIGILTPERPSSLCRSKPLILGILISKTRQLGAAGSGYCSNSLAEANDFTCKPIERNKLLSAPRVSGSSSTTNTIGSSAAETGEAGVTPSLIEQVPVLVLKRTCAESRHRVRRELSIFRP